MMLLADSSMWPLVGWLIACVIFICFSGLYSGAETGIYALNSTRLRIDAHDNRSDAIRLRDLLRDRGALLFSMLIGTNVANYLAPVCLSIVFVHILNEPDNGERERLAELYTTLILTPTVFIFGEVVPKNIFHLSADRLMRQLSRFIQATHFVCRATGLLFVQSLLTRAVGFVLRRGAAAMETMPARAEIYHMLRESAAEGTLSVVQSNMIERIRRLKKTPIADVMVPIGAVVMAEHDQTRRDLEPRLAQTRYSRIPVYERQRKNVIGLVHILDILGSAGDIPMARIARPPCRIPADATVVDALATLQREYERVAIVVDAQGECIGIASIKDFVEEIVGELAAY